MNFLSFNKPVDEAKKSLSMSTNVLLVLDIFRIAIVISMTSDLFTANSLIIGLHIIFLELCFWLQSRIIASILVIIALVEFTFLIIIGEGWVLWSVFYIIFSVKMLESTIILNKKTS